MVQGRMFCRHQLPMDDWVYYRSRRTGALTAMVRVDGPFTVAADGGGVETCPDGWLALDDNGEPFAVQAATHTELYQSVIAATDFT